MPDVLVIAPSLLAFFAKRFLVRSDLLRMSSKGAVSQWRQRLAVRMACPTVPIRRRNDVVAFVGSASLAP